MTGDPYIDWRRFQAEDYRAPSLVDSRRRLRWCLAGFVGLLVLVFGRMVQLEATQGPAFRELAARPLARRRSVPGVRGRILARNGTVLAYDRNVPALAVHYRYLQQPPDARWLRLTARSRLPSAERNDARRVAEEQARLLAERAELARRLAHLAGISVEQWNARAARVQARVERIADTVNRRRRAEFDDRRAEFDDRRAEFDNRRAEANERSRDTASDGESLGERVRSFLREMLTASMDESAPERITVAEQRDYHVMAEDLPLEVVAEIEAHPDRYLGVKIVERRRRVYPSGSLAAHVLGHLGPVDNDDLAAEGPPGYDPEDSRGKTGVERRYEPLLRGRRGVAVELTDRSGRVLSTYRQCEPGVGRDLVLTLDPELQQAAERLLAAAVRRRAIREPKENAAGGACVVLDVHTGEILAAASAPAFDPNLFAGAAGKELETVLSDPAHPLFDRVAKMAIPPGSVFKIVSAAALLDASVVGAEDPYFCRGYLNSPDRWRCAIFIRHGTGHGDVTLADALARSCNVYFFHYAGRLGPGPLVDWARAFGFGRPTGVDLPGEAAGTLPSPPVGPPEDRRWREGDTLALAIGQGSLEATPLQVARMIAAVANGGLLVTPHVASRLGLPGLDDGRLPARTDALLDDPIHVRPPAPIERLDAATLAVIREGLRRAVADERGTAHGTVWLKTIEVAGKTGTAETGPGRGDHAWFAGYAPAEKPRVAFVVALEHAGDAAEAAGPVAKRLVLAMQQLGYLDRRVGSLALGPERANAVPGGLRRR